MASSVYVSGTDARAGKSVVALGMVEMAVARAGRVGYFRPVTASTTDSQAELVRSRYGFEAPREGADAPTASEAREAIAAGDFEGLEKRVVSAYRAVADGCDVVVCEGLDLDSSAGLDGELDTKLAVALGCPVLAVVGCQTADEPAAAVAVALEALGRRGADVFGAVASRVPADRAEAARVSLDALDGPPVYLIPEQPELMRPTVAEVAAALGSAPLAGEADMDREVRGVSVAAAGVGAFLEDLEDGTLVIVPGDRADILAAGMAATRSAALSAPAGMVVTGDRDPEPAVTRLLDGASFPVLRAHASTLAVARAAAGVEPGLRPDDERRVATALGLFGSSVDAVELGARLAVPRPARMTPAMFEYELIERAKEDRRHIVLPEGDDERILRAADILLRRGVVELTILGDVDEVAGHAAELGLDLSGATLVDPLRSSQRAVFAERYYEQRKHRGVTEEMAEETVSDVAWFATMMVLATQADGMVSGAAHTTADTIRPAFQLIKARPGAGVVSSVFLMCMPDQVLVFGDCAVNPQPTTEQLVDIAISSAETAWSFGIEPRVAMLSYSTGDSAKGPDVTAVRDATELLRERRPDIPAEGPIQYDAAIEPAVAAQKMPESEVAGRASVFIFPDLETGNIAYKAVQRSSGALAIGPVLQGLRKPVNDLSRGCLVPDIVNTVVITAIQAQEADGRSTSRLAVAAPAR